MRTFGTIHACIAGDHRYSTIVEAIYDEAGQSVTVVRKENGAVGGMDGPGGAYGYEVRQRIEVAKPTGAAIVRAVKACFDSTIRSYGKPTKRFAWGWGRVKSYGLSAAKAKAAFEDVRDAR